MDIQTCREILIEETVDLQTIPYYFDIEINKDNFDFEDVLRMLRIERRRYEKEIENWKFCVELHRNAQI